MGCKIKEYRQRAGLTQTELARRTGISRATINGLENGHFRDTKTSTLVKICNALGASVDEVFFADVV